MRSCAAVILTATVVLLGTARADAGPAEDETLAAFEWFCLAHLNKATKIPGLFKAIRVKPIPDNLSQPFLSGHSGSAWFLPDNHTRMVVTLTDKGVCGVANPDVRGPGLKGLFERLLRNLHLSTERKGRETTTAYAVSYPDKVGRPDTRAVVLMTTSALASIKGVNLSAVPERIVLSEGTKIPNWP
jgi:hypothetical protein